MISFEGRVPLFWRSLRSRLAASSVVVGLALLPAASAGWANAAVTGGEGGTLPTVSALTVVEMPVPPFRVLGHATGGAYPQVSGGSADLRAVNEALRAVVLADQRAEMPSARTARQWINRAHPRPDDPYRRGAYRLGVERALLSASTVVVSALLPAERALFLGQSGSHGWLSMTFEVPSARRVRVNDLFADPTRGLRALGDAWRQNLPRERLGCVDQGFFGPYAPTADYFRNFALTPTGIAIGVATSGACGSWDATVPYVRVRRYLSKLGTRLVDAVRSPRVTKAARQSAAAVVSVKALPEDTELYPGRNVTVVTGPQLGFRVTVHAEGAPRSLTWVKLTLRQGSATTVRTATIRSIAAEEQESVVFSNVRPPALMMNASVQVAVTTRLPSGAAVTDLATYPVIFVRPARLPTEGARGIGLVTTMALPFRQVLSLDVLNHVYAEAFAVTVQNTGRMAEQDVRVTLRIDQQPVIVQTKSIDSMPPGGQRVVIFTPRALLQYVTPTRITVAIAPVPAEATQSNNSATYRVSFGL